MPYQLTPLVRTGTTDFLLDIVPGFTNAVFVAELLQILTTMLQNLVQCILRKVKLTKTQRGIQLSVRSPYIFVHILYTENYQ